jgi:hypothetical protein
MTPTPVLTDPARMSTPIIGKSGNALLTPPPDLVDEMLARYIDWRWDAAGVWDAYAAWVNAPASEKSSRFAAYIAAVDQEQSAATSYASVVENVACATQLRDEPKAA